jgi:hypothetical protein
MLFLIGHWSSHFNPLQSFHYMPYLFTKTIQIRDQFFLYMDPGGSFVKIFSVLCFELLAFEKTLGQIGLSGTRVHCESLVFRSQASVIRG